MRDRVLDSLRIDGIASYRSFRDSSTVVQQGLKTPSSELDPVEDHLHVSEPPSDNEKTPRLPGQVNVAARRLSIRYCQGAVICSATGLLLLVVLLCLP